MSLSNEKEAALMVIAGIWAAELKDIEPRHRRVALAKWWKRYDAIYEVLRDKVEDK